MIKKCKLSKMIHACAIVYNEMAKLNVTHFKVIECTCISVIKDMLNVTNQMKKKIM
jgi:hypothetical protein